MNWILTSFLMFVSSITYYLIIKKAQINKIENKLYMVANFSIPMVFYLMINIIQNKNIFVEPKMILLMFFNSLIFSYIGSVVSYMAIEKAPNAGYGLTIQKSYAVYTAIASVFLFGSQLSLLKFAAILIIIVSTAFIIIDKKNPRNNRKSDPRWVYYSILSFFLFGTLRLTNKLFLLHGVPVITNLFWSMFFVFMISLIELFRSKAKITTKLSWNNL